MSYVIQTENLTKTFRKTKAVDNLSLKVPEGSIYAFLGPNGAGKTTTIKMLATLPRLPFHCERSDFGDGRGKKAQ